MFAAAGEKGSQTPLGSLQSALSTEDRIKNWIKLVEQNAPIEQIQQAEYQVAEALKQHPFEIRQQLPFIREFVRKLDATTAFQQFRLPGRDRVVADRREEPPKGKPEEAAKGAAKEAQEKKAEARREATEALRLHEGKLVRHRDRTYAGYFGDRGVGRGGLDQQVAAERVERMLSAFEDMLVARFEGGKEVAQESPGGKPNFLAKTAQQWHDFFKSFLHRTVQKTTLLSEIREFLLRGLIPKGSKGIFIGDMYFTSGRIEKFVRFSILAEVLAKLKALVPGDAFGRGMLAGLAGEDMVYLALAASRAREFATSQLPAQGKFMSGRAEAAAAEALGIPLDQQLKQKAKSLRSRRGGLFGGDLLGEEGPAEDLPYCFVPWWHWGNLTRPGKFRWITVFFYTSLFILALMGIAVLTYRILGG